MKIHNELNRGKEKLNGFSCHTEPTERGKFQFGKENTSHKQICMNRRVVRRDRSFMQFPLGALFRCRIEKLLSMQAKFYSQKMVEIKSISVYLNDF